MPGKRAVWFSRYKQKEKNPGAGVSRPRGGKIQPDWGMASGSQSSARPGILRELPAAIAGFCGPGMGFKRAKDKKVLSPIGENGAVCCRKMQQFGRKWKVFEEVLCFTQSTERNARVDRAV